MKRKIRKPRRKWSVVQCEDGVEYLIPYGMEGDLDLNCPPLPVQQLVDVYRRAQNARKPKP